MYILVRIYLSCTVCNANMTTLSIDIVHSLVKSHTSQARELKHFSVNSEPCLCKNAHNLDDCSQLAQMSQIERRNYIKLKGICLGSLNYGHMKKDCWGRKICKTCSGFHPTSLHIESLGSLEHHANRTVQPQVEATSHLVNTADLDICNLLSLIVPVWLHQRDSHEKKVLVYALLHDQSDACLVKD